MSETTEEPKVPASTWVKRYVKIREQRAELSRQFEEDDAKLKMKLEKCESELLEACKAIGADGFKTEFGTVSRTVKKRFWTNDWHSFYGFVKEHGALELLEKRVAQTNMTTFLEENPDLHPPGLNVDSRYAVVVRRK
jgi:hypothetical protein